MERPHEVVENVCSTERVVWIREVWYLLLIFEIGALGLFFVAVLSRPRLLFAFCLMFFVLFVITITLLFRLDRGTVYCWETGLGVIIDCG